jgi:hypothetical protein
MNTPWNNWIRQLHRWLSIAFTLTVIANFAARVHGEPSVWITYSPLLPLALLLLSGLYLFTLPYVAKWRGD